MILLREMGNKQLNRFMYDMPERQSGRIKPARGERQEESGWADRAMSQKVGWEDLSEEVTFLTGMTGMRTENIPGKGKSQALRQA